MQLLIILIVALALAGGVYLFLTIGKKKSKEQTEENAVEMMTANEMFSVDEKYRDYTKENTQIIERILSDAQINNLYISVDSTAQRALFVYFQGFFNLPVEADDLKENTNGILTTLNDFETIHSRGSSAIGKAYESGITLYLNDEDTEVRAEILPDVGECIQDVYIYDVYDAGKRKVVKDKPNYTYNCSAVQLAYIIDTDVFAEYFTARGAKVAFFSKNELTDGDLNILQETYKEETVSKGTYFTYRNIDFYFFGRVPENWGIYNVVINDYGTDTEQIDNWLSCHYRYIVSGFNETDIIQLMSLLETDKNDTKRLIGKDYRIAFNFGDPSMCGEQYRYLCSNLATSARITMNGFLPYKFNLPQWFLQTCDTEFENYRMYISNIKR